MTLKIPLVDTADYRFPPEVEAALGGRTGWIDIPGPYLNGCTVSTAGGWGQAPQYRVDVSGWVHMRGLMVPIGTGTFLYVPPSIRPGINHQWVTQANADFASIALLTDGQLQLSTHKATTYRDFSLDPVGWQVGG